jgi:hypothetical protein
MYALSIALVAISAAAREVASIEPRQGSSRNPHLAVRDATSELPLFKTPVILSRIIESPETWMSGADIHQFGAFKHQTGFMRCMFSINEEKDRLFRIELIDGVGSTEQKYLDQLKFQAEFNLSLLDMTNLTNNTLVFNNTVDNKTKNVNIYRIRYFNIEQTKMNITSILTVKFLGKDGRSFDLTSNNMSVGIASPELGLEHQTDLA